MEAMAVDGGRKNDEVAVSDTLSQLHLPKHKHPVRTDSQVLRAVAAFKRDQICVCRTVSCIFGLLDIGNRRIIGWPRWIKRHPISTFSQPNDALQLELDYKHR